MGSRHSSARGRGGGGGRKWGGGGGRKWGWGYRVGGISG